MCVCTRRFSDASTSLYEFLLVSASVCVFACVCAGGFISSCRWPQSLIHRSTEMKSPLKSKGREERNGQTDMERVRGR